MRRFAKLIQIILITHTKSINNNISIFEGFVLSFRNYISIFIFIESFNYLY
jgi:hypothetical protein